jgi:hypothetical protein
MASRDGGIGRALTFFDGDGFRDHLAALVAIPSTSWDPSHADTDNLRCQWTYMPALPYRKRNNVMV